MRSTWRVASVIVLAGVTTGAQMALAQSASAPSVVTVENLPEFRLFLHDGTTLVSYGEPTRVGDRVVFSLPTSSRDGDQRLQLVNIAASQIDWDETSRYADAVRAARYVATHAEESYAMLNAEIAQAINDLSLTSDPAERLKVVERARRTLAEWPARHFNYRQNDINQMLAVFDEAIADLRLAAGIDRFDLTFVANVKVPESSPLLPKATVRDAIEQTVRAARLSETSVERVSLMSAALTSLERDAAELPAAWRREMRSTLRDEIAAELRTDRSYQSLTTRVRDQSVVRARNADVRGLEKLLIDVEREDVKLGSKRPDTVNLLLSSVREDLEAARMLQLDRDRWTMRLPQLRRFHAAVSVPVARLDGITDELEDIKAMSGSSPAALSAIQQAAVQAQALIVLLAPPEEFRSIHALLTGAAEMADRAARLRREAMLSSDLIKAGDASSAAAGAINLVTRAEIELRTVLSQPQLPK